MSVTRGRMNWRAQPENHIEDLQGQYLVISNQPNVGTDPLLNLVAQHGIAIAGKAEANIGAITALVANKVGLSVMNPITAQDQLGDSQAVRLLPFRPAVSV